MLVPVNWRLAGPEIAFIANDAEAEILFVGAEFLAAVAAIRDQLASVREVVVTDRDYPAWRDRQSATDPDLPMVGGDVCIQMYTSGTTGRLKGAQLTNTNLLTELSLLDTMGECGGRTGRGRHGRCIFLLQQATGNQVRHRRLRGRRQPRGNLSLRRRDEIWHRLSVQTLIAGLIRDDRTSRGDLSGRCSGFLAGELSVSYFELPADFGIGISHAVTPDLLVALDYHRTFWGQAFNELRIRFRAYAGGDIALNIPQAYRDIDTLGLGAQYRVASQLVLRAGVRSQTGRFPATNCSRLRR